MPHEMANKVPRGQNLKIKLEIDTDPPAGFATRARYLLRPIPFAVRVLELPDLFAGKMHALLFRRWVNRVKGRDWYDFVWFVAYHPVLHLHHLEQRMRQTGHWSGDAVLTPGAFLRLLHDTISRLDRLQGPKGGRAVCEATRYFGCLVTGFLPRCCGPDPVLGKRLTADPPRSDFPAS